MEYRGIRYTVRVGTERRQWAVAIHPAGVEMSPRFCFGRREEAERVARAMIDRWLQNIPGARPIPITPRLSSYRLGENQDRPAFLALMKVKCGKNARRTSSYAFCACLEKSLRVDPNRRQIVVNNSEAFLIVPG